MSSHVFTKNQHFGSGDVPELHRICCPPCPAKPEIEQNEPNQIKPHPPATLPGKSKNNKEPICSRMPFTNRAEAGWAGPTWAGIGPLMLLNLLAFFE